MAKSPKVFGDKPEGLTPFDEPERGDGDDFRMADHVGSVVIVVSDGIERGIDTKFGAKDALRCSTVKVIGDDGVTDFDDVLIFSSAVVKQARSIAEGEPTVARIVSYATKFSNDGYKFETPSAADLKLAGKYL